MPGGVLDLTTGELECVGPVEGRDLFAGAVGDDGTVIGLAPTGEDVEADGAFLLRDGELVVEDGPWVPMDSLIGDHVLIATDDGGFAAHALR